MWTYKDVHMSLQEQWKRACGHMCKWLKLTLWSLRKCQMLQLDQGHQTTDDGHHVMSIWIFGPGELIKSIYHYIFKYIVNNLTKRMSEWLLFNTKMSYFSAISWREQVTCWWDDDNDVCFVLDQHAELG